MQYPLLDEYIPLIIPDISVYIDLDKGLDLTWADFQWTPEDEDFYDDPDSIESGEGVRFFCDSDSIAADIKPYFNQTLRLPEVSYCERDQTLILSASALQDLCFSPKLGIKQGPAQLVDVLGEAQQGFHYLMLPEPLSPEQAQKRFAPLPSSQRPFIRLALGEFVDEVMVHKDVLALWHSRHIQAALLSLPEGYPSLEARSSDDFVTSSFFELTYQNSDMWQQNQGVLSVF